MKYWVYKDTRILGPLEKDQVIAVPGLDAGTLVCADENSAVVENGWRPLGELNDFIGLGAGSSWIGEEEASALALLEAREHIAALNAQIEALHTRVTELEGSRLPAAPPPLPAPLPAAPPPAAPEPPPQPKPPILEIPKEEPSSPPPVAAKRFSLGKPRMFKVMPTMKWFREISEPTPVPKPLEAEPASLETAPVIETPFIIKVAPPVAPVPTLFEPIPLPVSAPEPASIETVTAPPTIPATLAVSIPAPAPAPIPVPLETLPSGPEVLSRLSRPEPEIEDAPVKPARRFRAGPALVVGLVVLVAVGIGYVLLRRPKDLRQMTAMDDGRAVLGAPPLDEGLSMATAGRAAPASAAPVSPLSTAAQPGSQAQLDAAVDMVKSFPLDGGRGTVGRWLQYSYAAPGTGRESWNASATSDHSFLVEYRFTPAAPGTAEIHELFEADLDKGFVIGKSPEARELMAGGAVPPAAARKQAKRRLSKRARRGSSVKKRRAGSFLPLPPERRAAPPKSDESFGPGEGQAL